MYKCRIHNFHYIKYWLAEEIKKRYDDIKYNGFTIDMIINQLKLEFFIIFIIQYN